MYVHIFIQLLFFFPVPGKRGVYSCIFSDSSFPSSFYRSVPGFRVPSEPRGGDVCSFAFFLERELCYFLHPDNGHHQL